MAGLADLGRHDVDVDGEQAALLDGGDDGRHQCRPVTGRHRVHGILHDVGALLVDLLELVGVERGLVVIARPDVVDASATLDQQLVDIGRGPADVRVGRTRVAFLVAAHAHAAATRTADVAGGEGDVHERGVGAVVVVAPDEALLIGKHGAPTPALLRLGDPRRRLGDVLGPEAGDGGRVRERSLVRSQCFLEVVGRGGNERLVLPALGRDLRQQGIEQHHVGAGLDGEMQHLVLAGFCLTGGHRAGAPRIDNDHARSGVGLACELLLLLLQAGPAQVGDPVIEEIVGLGLVGVGADGDDGVAQLGVLVAVVELAHAHVARRVHLRIVGGAIVDADVLDLHRLEIELAGAPGVLVAAAGAAVVEG